MDILGGTLPEGWRHHPGLAFDVTVDVTPLEQGSFGHLGTLKWLLRAGLHAVSARLAQRLFTVHYACLCEAAAAAR